MRDAIQAMPEENTSGMGKFHEIPGEVEGWSWGAFFWTWLWAIANRTWVGLFTLLPAATTYFLAHAGPIGGANMAWARSCLIAFSFAVMLALHYLLGVNGRKWAWQNRRWRDVAQFNRVQRYWSIAAWTVAALLAVAAGFFAYGMHHAGQSLNNAIVQGRDVAWKVGRYIEDRHQLPVRLEDAGVAPPYGADIAELQLLPEGQLRIVPTGSAGKGFILAPLFNDNGEVEWRCMAGDMERLSLPPECRYDIMPVLRYPR